jgi:hypothetical protein
MNDDRFVYRYYKISINIGPICIYNNSRTYKILKGPLTIIVGIPFSLITLLLGFWGFSLIYKFKGIRNSLEALHINFSGGEDFTKISIESNYDDQTVYIFNNLLRKTSEKVTIEEINIITEIQDFYLENNKDKYSEENIDFIKSNLSKLDIHRINGEDIRDIFDAMNAYDDYCKEINIA